MCHDEQDHLQRLFVGVHKRSVPLHSSLVCPKGRKYRPRSVMYQGTEISSAQCNVSGYHGGIASMTGMCAPTVMAKKVCQTLAEQTLSLRCTLLEQVMPCVSSRLRRLGGILAVFLPHLRLSFHNHHLTHLLRKVHTSIDLHSEKKIVFALSADTERTVGKHVTVFRSAEKHSKN